MSKIICVDAGHGGKDPGACSNGVQEKEIALKIALKVKELLLMNNLDVVMTRESDRYDTVNEKARKANLAKADLFISIHCNAAEEPNANGTETLSYDLTGKSFQLAKCVQQELTNICQRRNRGVKERKDLAVLNSTQMPAILVETAFISNEEERKLLQKEDFQNKLAVAIVKGICDYLHIQFQKKENKKEEAMEKRYQTIEELPEWAKPTIQRLINSGVFADPKKLDLSMDMIRMSVIFVRFLDNYYNKK